jgi:O-antigen ligase
VGVTAQRATSYPFTTAACAATCALAPAYTVRWHVGFYPTTLLELAIVISVVVFVVELVRQREPLAWRSPFLIPAILFIVAGAIAVAAAPNHTAALGLYRAYILEPIAFAFVLINVMRTPQRVLLILGALALGAAVAGLANSFTVLRALINHTYDVTQTPPVVIYLTANAVALYVGPLTAVALSLALYEQGIARIGGIAFFLVGLVILALSFSRGGYLALAAVVFVASFTHRRRFYLLGLAVVGACALVLIPPIGRRIIIETENVYGNTVQSRLDLWSGAVQLIEHRPLFGAGLAGFQQLVAPYITNIHSAAQFIDPHNILLNFWVETGMLGVIAMIWIFVVAFRESWRGWRHGDARWGPYHLGVLLALVAVVTHGMVDVPYFKNDLSLEFWVLLALTWSGRLWAANRSPA